MIDWIRRMTLVLVHSILLQLFSELSIQALSDNLPSTELPHSTINGLQNDTGCNALAVTVSKPQISVIITSCVCITIALIGILGNLLVICVLTGSHTRLVYETFCVGLAVTDFTYLTLTTPITVVQYYFRGWIFGLFWCKVFNFVVQVTVFSSAFMLLGLTTSRFLSVVLPWQNLKMTELQAKLFCLGAWIAGVIFAVPVLVFQVLMEPAQMSAIRPNSTASASSLRPTAAMSHAVNSTCSQATSSATSSIVLCRALFPSHSSRMGYQLLVLLSTYVVPFIGILIMNSTIVYKLQQKSIIDRHQKQLKSKESAASTTTSRSANKNPPGAMRRSLNSRVNSSTTTSPNLLIHHVENSAWDAAGQAETNNNGEFLSNKSISTIPGTDRASSVNNNNNTNENDSSLTPMELVKLQKAEKKRRTRTKATKLVVLVTTLWCVCWLPTHIINSWLNFDEASFPFIPEMVAVKLLSQTLSFAASCVNPVVYGIMTGTFKSTITNKIFRRNQMAGEQNNGVKPRVITVIELVN